jgi:phosphoenolpyruvate carboxykinase (ATP)
MKKGVFTVANYRAPKAGVLSMHCSATADPQTGRSSLLFGKRIPLAYTRAIVDAIHSGALAGAPMQRDPVFGFEVVTECPGVPSEILQPRQAWADKAAYDASAKKLAGLFIENFKKHESGAAPEVRAASPVV